MKEGRGGEGVRCETRKRRDQERGGKGGKERGAYGRIALHDHSDGMVEGLGRRGI
jgi:hypothetical protein